MTSKRSPDGAQRHPGAVSFGADRVADFAWLNPGYVARYVREKCCGEASCIRYSQIAIQ